MATTVKVWALPVLLAIVLAACGNSVGGSCNAASDCPSGQGDGGSVQAVCLQGSATPGGYCAVPCASPGTPDDCPSGSICTALANGNYCAHVCQNQSDCRSGYNCNGVTGSTSKTCQ